MGHRRRLFSITFIFLKIFLDFRKELRLTNKLGYKLAQQKMETVHTRRATQLYEMAIESGGVFIKLCQFLSTRRDIFPTPYITILSPLQDQVPAVDFKVIETVLHEEYGDYSRFLKSVNKHPLASASLGQTHTGVLLDGTQVVLKVLKPDIHHKIDIDFAILFFVFKLLSHFQAVREKGDLPKLLDEFIKVTGDELNFRREVHVLKIFQEALKKYPYLHIPHVYEEYCTSDVIVMEYCDGDKISEVGRWKNRNNDPEIIAKRLVEIYMDQFLILKWIHFDPHPGNILVTSDNNFVLLDFGMAGQISEITGEGIKKALRSLVRKDYMQLIDVLDELGFIKKGYNKYKLLPVIEYFLDEVLSTIQLEREAFHSVDLSPVIDDLVELLYKQPLILPVEWAFLGRAVGTLVGIISTLNPDYKVTDELEPYLKKFLRSSLDDILDETQNYLKNYGMRLVNLPLRLSHVVEKVERGELRFRIDFEEFDDKLFEMKSLIISVACAIISISCLGSGYVLHSFNRQEQAYVLGGCGVASLIYGLVRRKNRSKEFIKKQITG